MNDISESIENGFKKAAPMILTCIGAVGVVATAVLSIKATPKALESIKEKEAEKQDELTLPEKIQISWRYYIPAGLCAIGTITCIFGANAVNMYQQASLISAYAFIDQSFKRYKNSVKDIYGEEGHEKVLNHIMVEESEKPGIYNGIMGGRFDFGETDDEEHLFYDAFSNRYFTSTFADVLLAELHTNRNFAIGGGVSLKTFYDFLGLDTPKGFENLYLSMCDGYQFIDFIHSKHCIDDGDEREPVECWCIEMIFEPGLDNNDL